jgi:3-oxoacyl-[acyl-carrier-protein] synthase-3
MAFLSFNNVGIAALTCAVPSFVQKINAESGRDPAYVKTFLKQTGITQRHISLNEQTCVDLGYAAAEKALDKAGWSKDSLDALVFMSQTPDFNPGTCNGCLLQYFLGLPQETLAFDITLGCSSFPYGLSVCAALMQQKNISRVLMVSGDTMWPSYASKEELLAQDYFIPGEGCTAVLFEKREENKPIHISLHSDGSGYKFLFNPFAGTKNAWRLRPRVILPNGAEFYHPGCYMDGLEITSFASTTVVESIKNFLVWQNTTLDDYDGLVLHQANLQIIKSVAKRLKADMGKVPVSVDRYANTSGTSITLTMADAYAGCEAKTLHLLTCGFGIGLSWGIASLEINPAVIEPIFTYDGRFEENFVKFIEEN